MKKLTYLASLAILISSCEKIEMLKHTNPLDVSPSGQCYITSVTTASIFNMSFPTSTTFNFGQSYAINASHSNLYYNFFDSDSYIGRSVDLFLNETLILNIGESSGNSVPGYGIVWNGSSYSQALTIILPSDISSLELPPNISNIPSSHCYTIRLTEGFWSASSNGGYPSWPDNQESPVYISPPFTIEN